MGKALFHMTQRQTVDINVLQKKQFYDFNNLLEEKPGGKKKQYLK